MFDKLIAFGIALADKHLALATLLLGVVSLYVLGFDADKLISGPYTIAALVLFDMFIRVSTYIHTCAKLQKITESAEEYGNITEDVCQIKDSVAMQLDILSTLVNNATQLNSFVVRIYSAIQGMPSKQQFKIIVNLATQKLSLELWQTFTSYACNSKSGVDPLLTVQKLRWDFDALVTKYIENTMVYNNHIISEDFQHTLREEISKFTESMCNSVMGSQSLEDKFYSAMIAAKSLENNLIFMWDNYIKLLPYNFLATIHVEGD